MRTFRSIAAIILFCLIAAAAGSATAQSPERGILVAWEGDVMLGRGVAQGMGEPGHEDPLAAVRERLKSADLTIANMESPLTTLPHISGNPYILYAPPGHVAVLTASGFDAMGVANNHATDNGRDGLAETLRTLGDAGIATYGGGNNLTEAYSPAIVERGGLRLGLLAYNMIAGSLTAKDDAPGVANFDAAAARLGIATAHEKADVVIVQLHWGIEYATQPTEAQRKLARQLIEAGADAIISHHPHVVQPVEWIARPGKPPAFVAYSLGNFLFDSKFDDTRRGLLLETLITRNGVVGFRAVPVFNNWLGAAPLDTPKANAELTARLLPDPATRVTARLTPDADWWVPPPALATIRAPILLGRRGLRPALPGHGPIP